MFEVIVNEATQVAEARRRASAAATASGFGETAAGRVALVATELASNLVKHGGGGRLLVDAVGRHVDLLALDGGTGMADIGRCMADGFSTAGTAGNGLGAVRRLAQPFALVSWPGRGAAVMARVDDQPAPPEPMAGEVAPGTVCGVVVPRPGETACGDAWSHAESPGCFYTLFDIRERTTCYRAQVAFHRCQRLAMRSSPSSTSTLRMPHSHKML